MVLWVSFSPPSLVHFFQTLTRSPSTHHAVLLFQPPHSLCADNSLTSHAFADPIIATVSLTSSPSQYSSYSIFSNYPSSTLLHFNSTPESSPLLQLDQQHTIPRNSHDSPPLTTRLVSPKLLSTPFTMLVTQLPLLPQRRECSAGRVNTMLLLLVLPIPIQEMVRFTTSQLVDLARVLWLETELKCFVPTSYSFYHISDTIYFYNTSYIYNTSYLSILYP